MKYKKKNEMKYKKKNKITPESIGSLSMLDRSRFNMDLRWQAYKAVFSLQDQWMQHPQRM